MADNNSPGILSGPKAAWNNPKARKGMLMFGGVATIVIVISLAMVTKETKKNKDIPASASISAPTQNTQGDQLSATSEKYKAMVRELDERRAEDAQKVPGTMALPKIAGLTDPNAKPIAGPVMTVDAVNKQQAVAQGQPSAVVGSGQKAAPTPQELARMNVAYAPVAAMMNAAVLGSMTPENGWAAVKPPQAISANLTPGQTGAASPGTGLSNMSPLLPSVPPLIAMGTTVFATLDTAINTDYSGPVLATIRQGKYSGARLIGTKALERDAVVIKFSLLSPNDGEAAVPVSAYAITIDEARKFGLTGLQGETDHHVVQRYVIPAAMAFVAGYGQAASQPNQTVVSSAAGNTQTTTPLDSKARLIAAAGIAVQPLVADLTKQAARPITISKDANSEIGIMFTADVLSASGNKSAAPLPSIDQQISQQQQQQQMQQIQQQQQRNQQQPMQGYGYPNMNQNNAYPMNNQYQNQQRPYGAQY